MRDLLKQALGHCWRRCEGFQGFEGAKKQFWKVIKTECAGKAPGEMARGLPKQSLGPAGGAAREGAKQFRKVIKTECAAKAPGEMA